MSRFDAMLESTIFSPASREEAKKRKKKYAEVCLKEWMEEFPRRKDVRRNSDGSYDVEGSVFLDDMGLKRLPVRFGVVDGLFSFTDNLIVSMDGTPREVNGAFWCQGNRLTSLEGGPEIVDGGFFCGQNRLVSLVGSPRMISQCFDCGINLITSLEGAPDKVVGDFICSHNNLTSLEGAPKDVEGDFYCNGNPGKFTEEDVMKVCDVWGEIYV